MISKEEYEKGVRCKGICIGCKYKQMCYQFRVNGFNTCQEEQIKVLNKNEDETNNTISEEKQDYYLITYSVLVKSIHSTQTYTIPINENPVDWFIRAREEEFDENGTFTNFTLLNTIEITKEQYEKLINQR